MATDPTSRPLRVMLLGPMSSIHLRRWAAALSARGHAVRVVSMHRCDAADLPPGVEHAWWSTRAGALCVEIEADPEVFGLAAEPQRSRGRRTRIAPARRGSTVRIAS